jgi:DNA-binding NtrC family response regulator
MKAVLEEIDLLSEAHAISVLITGESGTGKELVARAIHFGGPRSEGPFVPVNCSAIPRDLADALFFGHVKGAFTGADDDREGYFALAEGGTLFLDEIGDMPVDLQPKLLRTLEDSRYRPLGARQERTADVRVVAATAADPSPERLRRDLYFRLAQYSVALPPLRHRREDIPLLAGHFLRLLAGEMNREPPALDEAVLEVLMTYDFPGNVRELKNLVERALIKSRGAEIRREHLELGQPTEAASTAPVAPGVSSELPFDLERAAAWAEEEVLRRALAQSDDNVSAAARLLGTNRPRLYRILERLKDGTTDL